jgi:hypothetical protein
MAQRRRSVVSALVFFAFTTPLGIAAHLISELAGLGWHDDVDAAFPRANDGAGWRRSSKVYRFAGVVPASR